MEVEDEGEVMIETLDVEEDHEEETDKADELPEEDYTGKCLGMFFSEYTDSTLAPAFIEGPSRLPQHHKFTFSVPPPPSMATITPLTPSTLPQSALPTL